MQERFNVSILTNGCNECRLEAAEVETSLKNDGQYRVAADSKQADLILFFGCCSHQGKEDLSRAVLQELDQQKQPGAVVLPVGCLARVRPELRCESATHKELVDRIEKFARFEEHVPLNENKPHPEFWDIAQQTFGRAKAGELLSAYRNNMIKALPTISNGIPSTLSGVLAKYRRLLDREFAFPASKTFCIRVSTGCMGNCAYCSIKLSRGRVRSKPIPEILDEFSQGIDQGYKDFALLGTDIGDYGKDRKKNLTDLLEALVSRPEQFKLRLRNTNPRWLIPHAREFCDLLQSGKIVYALLPVESGSNRILKAMHRGYRAEDFISAVDQIRAANPKVFLATQVMVGFPGETEEDYRQTVDLLRRQPFDYFEVYRYSRRPGTHAAELPDVVPEEIIARRYHKLLLKSFVVNPLRRLAHLSI